jgi:predicted hydrocarbon binding protein
MLMLTSGAWVTLNAALRQAFGEGAVTYMHEVGYCIGISFGEDLKGKDWTAKAVMEILPAIGRSIGWGEWRFSGDTRSWKKFTASVHECPSCVSEQPGTPPLCDLLVGVLNGTADEVFGSPHIVTETRCGYKIDGLCEFLIEETSEKSEEQKHWASFVMFPWLRRRK